MGDQQKIILDAVGFPITSSPAIMLFFNYQFLNFPSINFETIP